MPTDGSTTELGQRAEGLAAVFLQRQGYRILAQNYRCRGGEIDIVAEEGAVLCFVEVRSRHSRCFGDPLETISRRKQQRLIRAARHFLARSGRSADRCRFDVIGIVYQPELSIQLVRDAFDLSDVQPGQW